ncbi:DNA-binding transcriptional regulator Fis [Methylomonas sp. LL1]|uniref:DNA-binding transcriptional regulator Fis n=1 Tax=Methylomonas sp. LL1 TaxID=2785785 RepID=UPI0018C449BF|nr:DNA-binding transcriptional regulator Fis [Methylomonas sp. LL1]QPK63677.1 DNA-binding transcriptional regulator Fis [Methylomonas sp. LL1]
MEVESIKITNSNGHTLSDHVRQSVEDYFAHLNGHDSSGLYQLVLTEVEKPLLETALKHSDFNQSKAAKILGLSRSTLRKKLDQYGIG